MGVPKYLSGGIEPPRPTFDPIGQFSLLANRTGNLAQLQGARCQPSGERIQGFCHKGSLQRFPQQWLERKRGGGALPRKPDLDARPAPGDVARADASSVRLRDSPGERESQTEATAARTRV